MRKTGILTLFLAAMLFSFTANAGGGSVGLVPATGVKLSFGNGGTSTYIPFRFEGEGYLGGSNQHGIGGAFGFDLGTGFWNFNLVSFAPEYKYYFNGGTESSPFVGAYTDFRFRNSFSIIGVGAQGGYQHVFDFGLGVFGVGSVGFQNAGFSGARGSGGEFSIRAGAKYYFGR